MICLNCNKIFTNRDSCFCRFECAVNYNNVILEVNNTIERIRVESKDITSSWIDFKNLDNGDCH